MVGLQFELMQQLLNQQEGLNGVKGMHTDSTDALLGMFHLRFCVYSLVELFNVYSRL